MKPLDIQDLIQYVEGTLTDSEQATIEEQLANSPENQRNLAKVQEMLQGMKPSNSLPLPSDDVMGRVTAVFRRHTNKKNRPRLNRLASLQFDSHQQWQATGARGHTSDRQMLFSADPYDIDIQIIQEEEPYQLMLLGQILGAENNLAGFEVHLTNDEQQKRRVLTDHLGRFSFSYLEKREYTLHILLDTQEIMTESISIDTGT